MEKRNGGEVAAEIVRFGARKYISDHKVKLSKEGAKLSKKMGQLKMEIFSGYEPFEKIVRLKNVTT